MENYLGLKMKLDKLEPQNRSDDLLSAFTENTDTFNKRLITWPQKVLETKITKPLHRFSFNRLLILEGYSSSYGDSLNQEVYWLIKLNNSKV